MTPAINTLKKAGISHTVHSYKHESKANAYGLEAAEKMGVEPNRVFKTLVALVDGKDLVVSIVPVSHALCLKSLASSCGGKRAEMADKQKVQRVTGYVLGGVSPIGQRKALPTIIDASAQSFDTIFVSAGKRGLEVELNATHLAQITNAIFADIRA
ncbi:MAG TPA: Cys-tRNA(Pro) deacylase [Pseudomonadales bacterium]|nr:Cys-tRNA(Pro) deacylase [Pseudomonadales bacterium]